jgi:hypothetical protein
MLGGGGLAIHVYDLAPPGIKEHFGYDEIRHPAEPSHHRIGSVKGYATTYRYRHP